MIIKKLSLREKLRFLISEELTFTYGSTRFYHLMVPSEKIDSIHSKTNCTQGSLEFTEDSALISSPHADRFDIEKLFNVITRNKKYYFFGKNIKSDPMLAEALEDIKQLNKNFPGEFE